MVQAGFTRVVRIAWGVHVLYLILGVDNLCTWYLRMTRVHINVYSMNLKGFS